MRNFIIALYHIITILEFIWDISGNVNVNYMSGDFLLDSRIYLYQAICQHNYMNKCKWWVYIDTLWPPLTRLLRWYSTLKVCTFIVLFWFSSLNTKPIKTMVSKRGQILLCKFLKLIFCPLLLTLIYCCIYIYNIGYYIYYMYIFISEIQVSCEIYFSSNFQ